MEIPKGKKNRARKPAKPGGKALERLHQFEAERGLEPTEVQAPKAEKGPPPKSKKKPK